MKKIYWNILGREVLFNINNIEYIILKNIFKRKKYKILKKEEIRGYNANVVIYDELSNVDWKTKVKIDKMLMKSNYPYLIT